MLEQLGFDPLDAGPLKQARYLEPLAMLSIDLAIRGGLGSKWGLKVLSNRCRFAEKYSSFNFPSHLQGHRPSWQRAIGCRLHDVVCSTTRLESSYAFEILPTGVSNYASDMGIVESILQRDPWMVGFTCYLWNIDRTLWIARQLKAVRPDLCIVLGGPEITIDNAWVQQSG